jgi:hypothetical protein
MNDRIHFPLAKLAASDLLEAIVAAQYDAKNREIHRETIEHQFRSLSKELGIRITEPDDQEVEPVMFSERPGFNASTGRPV